LPGSGRKIAEKITEGVIYVSGGATIAAVLLIFLFLLKEGLPLFKTASPWKFLTGTDWYPLSDIFEILPLIAASLLVTAGAVVIAIPLGVACAIYIAEVARPTIREILKPTVEILAGIPSVVIGFIGLVVLAPFIQKLFDLPTGVTALAGSVMLAFMAMPTIISISEDALAAVPRSYAEASFALGATHWQTIRSILVPAARSGILAAAMLGVGRAIGETMTVMMVTGNAAILPQLKNWLFLQPVRTMTATIASEMGETVQGSPHYYSLFAIGIVLFGMTFVINLIADIALQRQQRR